MKQLFWILAIVPSLSFGNQTYAALTNFRSSSPFCKDKLSIHDDDDSATIIQFSSIQVERGSAKPFIRCRILADLFIRAHHSITPGETITARVRGHFEQIGDQVGAKLLLSLLDQRSSSFLMQRQADAIANESGEEHGLEIQAVLPPNAASEHDRTITLVILLEGMINYRLDQDSKVSATLETIRFPRLKLSDSAQTPTNGDAS